VPPKDMQPRCQRDAQPQPLSSRRLLADDGQLCPTQRLGDWFGHRGEQVAHETLDESAREQLLPVRQCLTQLSQPEPNILSKAVCSGKGGVANIVTLGKIPSLCDCASTGPETVKMMR
jgi:hypothetical protein